jgi:hypothetical protein
MLAGHTDPDEPQGVNVEGTPMTPQHIHSHTDRGALLGQLQHAIQRTIHLAALGLNAMPRLTQADLELPGTSISLQLAGPAPWPIEEARERFQPWLLGNGLRDATEAITLSGRNGEIFSRWREIRCCPSKP